MAVVTSASNVTGEAPPLAKIRKLLPEDVLFVVDGAQGAGHLPLSMKELGLDALALAGHKGMGGIQGSGALLFSERMEISPLLFGGTGSESFDLGMPAFYPDRLESGTLSYPAVCSLYEGALLVKSRREEWAGKLERTTGFVSRRAGRAQRLYGVPLNPMRAASAPSAMQGCLPRPSRANFRKNTASASGAGCTARRSSIGRSATSPTGWCALPFRPSRAKKRQRRCFAPSKRSRGTLRGGRKNAARLEAFELFGDLEKLAALGSVEGGRDLRNEGVDLGV